MLADYLNLQIEPVIIGSAIGSVNWGHRISQTAAGDADHQGMLEWRKSSLTGHHYHHQPDNLNWTGILGILEEGMADTVCTLYPYTDEKGEYFNFSHPVTGVNINYC